MKANFITTGEAAKIHSVTPDTVLKWIKSGKLQAHRTAGGHYRIDPSELKRFLVAGLRPAGTDRPSQSPGIQYCWEYKSKEALSKKCRECIVYRLRAQRCYEVAKIESEIGHRRLFCKRGCQDCEYYRQVCEIPIRILLVTADEALTAAVRQGTDLPRYRIEIADCGYSCCTVVEQFKPDYVVIDCSLGRDAARHLCGHLLEDHRIPYVRVIMAARQGEFPDACDKHVFARVEKPFGIEDVAKCISGAAEG